MRFEIAEDRPLSADDADALTSLCVRQDGVISRRQALALMTEKALRHKVASGRWRVVHRGVFLTHSGAVTPSQRLWIALLAVGAGLPACLGGLSALLVWGLRRIESPAIHVLLPAGRRVRPPAGVVIHRVACLPPEHWDRTMRPPATFPARSVVDAARWSRSDDEARLIIASSFQQRLVVLADVDRVLADMPNVRRRPLILRTAADCAGGSHSVGELDVLALCRRNGLPEPSRQVMRRDRTGRRRYLDVYFDEWKIVIEIDGAHHMSVDQMWDDQSRQNDLELAGFMVLRYPVFVVRQHPERVAAELRAALISAGWRPAAARP